MSNSEVIKEKESKLFTELKRALKTIKYDFNNTKREIEDLLKDFRIIDFYITTEIPPKFFNGTVIDVMILTKKALLGYEIKKDGFSLLHVLPIDKILFANESLKEEEGKKYIIASFKWGLGSLSISVKPKNKGELRNFYKKVSKKITGVTDYE